VTSRPARRAPALVAALAAALAVALGPGAGAAEPRGQADPEPGVLVLPAPVGEIPLVAPEVVTPERRRTTFVPGPVRDDERIEVRVGKDGTPAAVVVTQRLELSGTGDYAVRERGPALRVRALEGTTAPIIQRGTVVWQGFVPGRRLLAAELELDPAREALLLPLRVELAFTPTAADARVDAGGEVTGAGRLEVRLVNQTARPQEVPTGIAAAADLAGPLDVLRTAAMTESLRPPPAAGRGLPATLPAADLGTRSLQGAAPLRISGTVTVAGAGPITASGAGVTSLPAGDGAEVRGVLEGETTVTLDVPAAGTLVLDLTVVPALDPRRLEPPGGAATWAAWADTRPDEDARRAAVDTLVAAAAAAARADEVAPYLGHPGPGETTTQFRYVVAPAPRVRAAREPLSPRPAPIAATVLLVAAVAAGGVATWRRL